MYSNNRVKAFIANGWDKRTEDPNANNKNSSTSEMEHTMSQLLLIDVEFASWPKGPYTQQIQGILPPLITENIILMHLQALGKQLKAAKKKDVPTNIDYSTLQRGHQYFKGGYIPGKYLMFCTINNSIFIKARCYRSQKKHDTMHEVKVAISSVYSHSVTRAVCSCVAGKGGMCSHAIGLLKQIIHYVMMKLQYVPEDMTCTQMQQSWHKPRPSHIEAEPVMNVAFCNAKQQEETKKLPAICTLYEARAHAVQDYSYEQQPNLKAGLLESKPTCTFAQILPDNDSQLKLIITPFGWVPKGSIISYQSLEYKKLDDNSKPVTQILPSLPIGILDSIPCVYSIKNDQQALTLDKLRMSLKAAHDLEQSTKQQSSSTQWKVSRIGKVTASCFGDVLLR